jgi:predicted esterase
MLAGLIKKRSARSGMPQSHVVERHLEVLRTARYWVAGDEVSGPDEVWYVLHGYRQLARRFLRRFEPLADGTRRIVAPEALSRFYTDPQRGRHGATSSVGATWMTREDREHEIADYVRYLDTLADEVSADLESKARVTVLGFSQGVATACRWVTRGRIRPRRMILWGDFLPPDLDMERARATLSETEWITVRGVRDPALHDLALEEAEAERLGSAGLAVRRVVYEGSHDIDQIVLQNLASDQT